MVFLCFSLVLARVFYGILDFSMVFKEVSNGFEGIFCGFTCCALKRYRVEQSKGIAM